MASDRVQANLSLRPELNAAIIERAKRHGLTRNQWLIRMAERMVEAPTVSRTTTTTEKL